VYDGKMRRRVRREYAWQSSAWVETNEVHYVYDGNLVIQERDINNLPRVSYTRGRDLSGSLEGAGGIGGLLARTDHAILAIEPTTMAAHSYYHADGNGNVTALINTLQVLVATYLYDPYGNILSASGPLANANVYQFSSKEYHQNAGLIYYLYRYCDPNLQRWLNRDPFGERGFMAITFPGLNIVAETSLGANLYEVADDNLVGNIDPFGLSGITTGKGFGHGKACRVDCASAEAKCNAAVVLGCGILGITCPYCGVICGAAGVLGCHRVEKQCEADNKSNGFEP